MTGITWVPAHRRSDAHTASLNITWRQNRFLTISELKEKPLTIGFKRRQNNVSVVIPLTPILNEDSEGILT